MLLVLRNKNKIIEVNLKNNVLANEIKPIFYYVKYHFIELVRRISAFSGQGLRCINQIGLRTRV